MPAIETQALVLEAREYRETSLLTTLLTPGLGRISGVAKGARRPKSGLAGVLQPFSLIAARLSMRSESGGGLASITSAELIEHPDYIRPGGGEDALARMAYAGVYAEVLAQARENDPHSDELFQLARYFLLGLAAAPHPGSFAVHGYFALLAALGYAPGLEMPGQPPPSPIAPAAIDEPGALAQQTTRAAPKVFHVNLLQGVLRPVPEHTGRGDHALSREALLALQQVLATIAAQTAREDFNVGDPAALEIPVVNRRVGPALVRLALRLFETHLEHGLRSTRFLEEMVFDKRPGSQ